MNILIIEDDAAIRQELKLLLENALSVSYTHLTLPTTPYV